MAEDRPDDYVLRGGDEGARRLRLLAAVKWPSTRTLLKRLVLRQGMHCLDVGCGIGAVTLKLARKVGPSGRVVGTDRDERCIQIARQEAQRRNLPADFRAESVGALREEDAFDLVYSRFLLSHLAHPEQAIQRLVAAARPGGMVAVEDVEFAGHFCYPRCGAFDRFVSLYEGVVRRKGGDANLGPRLLGLFLEGGLEAVGLEVVQPTYRAGPGKRMAQVTLEHIREAVLHEGLSSPAEVDALVAALDEFAGDARTLMSLPRIFQVWGRKRQN
jgi:SAM-dependent methyltransferase